MAERANGKHASGVRWNLGDLYAGPHDPALRRDVEVATRDAEGFETRFRGCIASGQVSAAELAEALARYETIVEHGDRPAFYASLLLAADTQDPQAQKLDEDMREASTELHNRLLFLSLELQKVPEARFAELAGDPALASRLHYLRSVRRWQPHTLSEPEEQLVNRKRLTGASHSVALYEELTGSLRFELEVDGEQRVLTDGEVFALLRRPERDLRRRALETFLSTYRAHGLVLTSIFNNLLLDHRIDSDLRRFPSLAASRHLDNDVDPAAVEAMMDATDRHYPDIQEYFRAKAELLGLPRMAVTDLHAPLGDERDEIPFDQARALVLDAFAGFSERFAALAGDFFERGWIDAEVRPGKRHGAFCAAHSPAEHPYVLASYAGTSRDVSTLAHELGHGIHYRLAGRLPLLVYDSPLVLAETASVFGEMLLTEHWLRRATSAAERVAILCDTLDDIYGTIFRQNALTRFELAAHEERRSGRLEADRLAEIWRAAQRPLFGDAVEIPEIYGWGWSYIPHFVNTPFYCYAYSFGNLLVLALFERYREEGPAFVPRYERLLESGGSAPPAELLAGLGIDVSSPEFWEGGFRAIRNLVEELRRTLGDAAA